MNVTYFVIPQLPLPRVKTEPVWQAVCNFYSDRKKATGNLLGDGKGFFGVYFTLSFFVWLVVFHVHMAMRLYLFRIPKHIMWFYFFLAFGTWSALTIILGFSLDLVTHSPGSPGYVVLKSRNLVCFDMGKGRCLFFKEDTKFMFGAVVSVFYLVDIILLISILFIIARMLRVSSISIFCSHSALTVPNYVVTKSHWYPLESDDGEAF